ncbi:MAG: UDP-N-acetylglucosamine pyrophosphorylase [Ruminococcaceae bacterium]|nr:UDP-N-acetylglucosamine pyrophosphorylase [Oscillospiraceae bacterium]
MPLYTTAELFDLSQTLAAPLLADTRYPWQALDGIADFILAVGPTLPAERFGQPQPGVWVAKSATVAPTASIAGPCIIDEDAEVRHCAFIRGSAIIGRNAVVGNSTEVKNSILFNGAQVPHFNYVGDSIVGYKGHLGAGAITSNVKSDKTPVVVKADGEQANTARKKVGAMVGDHSEVGCNSVLCPGSVLGKHTLIYPTSCVRGQVPHHSIFKGPGNIVPLT